MTVEFTAFDLGLEVGTFQVVLDAAPEVGAVIEDEGCSMQLVSIRRWDAESLELEADIEYV